MENIFYGYVCDLLSVNYNLNVLPANNLLIIDIYVNDKLEKTVNEIQQNIMTDENIIKPYNDRKYTAKNCCNYILTTTADTSNIKNLGNLIIIECALKRRPMKHYIELRTNIDDEVKLQHFFNYLKFRDIFNFNPQQLPIIIPKINNNV